DIVLIEAVSGRRLAYAAADMRAIGVALAHLHSTPVPDLPRFERFTRRSREDAVTLIARAVPPLQPALEALNAQLTCLEPARDALGSLHGDVHPKNVVVDGARLALIDVEGMAWGPRA